MNEKGSYNESHVHYSWSNLPLWSGIYYVDPGQLSDGGRVGGETVFKVEDPIGIARPSENNGDALVHEVEIPPEPGMVLFPSTLRHHVEPYRGDSQRITTAWNLFYSRFHIPDGGGEEKIEFKSAFPNLVALEAGSEFSLGGGSESIHPVSQHGHVECRSRHGG